MIQDLVFVVDKEPDFAEAHNMLALARLQGGGVHSATESIKVAIQLNPRSEQYLLNLAQIDLAGKKWDDATALLERLKDSSDPQICADRAQESGRSAYAEEVWRAAAAVRRRHRQPGRPQAVTQRGFRRRELRSE